MMEAFERSPETAALMVQQEKLSFRIGMAVDHYFDATGADKLQALRKAIRELVTERFEIRQQLRQRDVNRLERRLEAVRAQLERDAERLNLAAELQGLEDERAAVMPGIVEQRKAAARDLAVARKAANEVVAEAERAHTKAIGGLAEIEHSFSGREHRLRRQLHALRDPRITEAISKLRDIQHELRYEPLSKWTRAIGWDSWHGTGRVVETNHHERAAELRDASG